MCELAAVTDPDTARVEKLSALYHIPGKYSDYRKMLAEVKPDIVSISTSTRPRPEIIITAAEMGVRGIFAEKALCGSMEEADRIVEACKKHGVIFNYGTNRRYDVIYGMI